jgi:hypothetical protein
MPDSDNCSSLAPHALEQGRWSDGELRTCTVQSYCGLKISSRCLR